MRLLKEALAEIKPLQIREPRVARKAVFRQPLEEETRLLVLLVCVEARRIVGIPGQRAAQKAEALWPHPDHACRVAQPAGPGCGVPQACAGDVPELQTAGPRDSRERHWSTPERRHAWWVCRGGCGAPVLRHHLPMQDERQDTEKQGQSYRAWSCVHG